MPKMIVYQSVYFHSLHIAILFLVFEKKILADKLLTNPIDTWDYYWMFSRLKALQFVVRPGAPLTTNIGFSNHSGSHIYGEKPAALKAMDDIKIIKPLWIDQENIVTDRWNTIACDYKRFYSRNRLNSFLFFLPCLVRQPVFSLNLILKHLLSLFYCWMKRKMK